MVDKSEIQQRISKVIKATNADLVLERIGDDSRQAFEQLNQNAFSAPFAIPKGFWCKRKPETPPIQCHSFLPTESLQSTQSMIDDAFITINLDIPQSK